MANYLVNKNAQSNGDHEVHKDTCNNLPLAQNRLPLGIFTTCEEAVKKAKLFYSKSNGCKHCAEACHTT